MLLHVSVVHSFLLLSNIPLYGHTEICLYIHLWWIFRMSVWRFLWIRPLWTFFVCMSLCGYMGFLFFWIYVFIAKSYGNYMFNYKKLQNHSPLCYFTVSPAEHESFCCFTCLPVLGIVPTLFRGRAAKCSLWDLISPPGILPGSR